MQRCFRPSSINVKGYVESAMVGVVDVGSWRRKGVLLDRGRVWGEKGEDEKGEEDEESPKTGGMLLFGTLFKYMDKDKEDGVEKNTELETSKAKTDEGNDRKVDSAESAPMEEEERLKAGEKEEPDLTTPPPPQEEMDTASVPPSI